MIARQSTVRCLARQSGVVAVYVAIFLVAMLTAVMLAVEVGRIFVAHRQLQKMASLAALDAVREVSGCEASEPPALADLVTEVNESLDRNGELADLENVDVEAGRVQVDTATGRRSLDPLPESEFADAQAVRVSLRAPFPDLLTGFLTPASGTMEVSATAEQAALGSFFLGSGLLGVDTSSSALLNPLLTGLFGSSVNLSVVQFNGLASANVSLQQLATAIGVEVQDLSNPAATSTNLPTVLNGLSPLIDGTVGGTGQSISSLLTTLGSAASANAQSFPLSELIGSVDPLGPDVPVANLLDLIVALGAAAAPTQSGQVQPINLGLSLNGGNVLQSRVFIKVLEPPRFSGLARPGLAEASTAQIRLMVRLQVTALSALQPVLNGLICVANLVCTVTGGTLNLGVDIDVATASALLDRIQCPRNGVNNGDPIAELSAQTSVSDVTVGTFTGSIASAPAIATGSAQLLNVNVGLVNLLGILQVANINLSLFLDSPVSTNVGGSGSTELDPVVAFTRCIAAGDPDPACSFSGDNPTKPYWLADAPVPENPQTVGSTELLGSTLSSLLGDLQLRATSPSHPGANTLCLLKLLGICLVDLQVGPVLNAVVATTSGVLSPVLSTVGSSVDSTLDPLLELLGIELGSATVTMSAVTVDQPRIVSTALPPATP